MIKYFDAVEDNGLSSIYESYITFNKDLLKYFDDAFRVRVGIEENTNKVLVFLLNKDYALSGEIKESSMLPISVSKTYARVCSKPLIDYIKRESKIDIPKKSYKRFESIYDDDKKAIIIDLSKEV